MFDNIHQNTPNLQEIISADQKKPNNTTKNPGQKAKEKFEQDRKKPPRDRESWGRFGGGINVLGGFTVGPDGFLVGAQGYGKNVGLIVTKQIGIKGMRITKKFLSPNDENRHSKWLVIEFFNSENELQAVTVPYTALGELKNGSGDAKKILKKGFPLPNKKSEMEQLASCMQLMEKELTERGEIETIECVSKPGWHNGDHIFPGHEKYAGTDLAMLDQAGDPEIWRTTMRKILKENPVLGFIHSWGLSGFLKGKIVTEMKLGITPILNVFGGHSTGKSFGIKTLTTWQNSIAPADGKHNNIVDGASTFVGSEIWLQANNHGFVYIDEFGVTMESVHNPIGHVMKLCNNGKRVKGGGRADEAGGVSSNIKKWDSMLITSANMCITKTLAEGNEMYSAAISRVLEIDADKFPVWDKWYNEADLEKIENDLLNNYGHGYKPFVDYISKNTEKISEKFLETRTMLRDHIIECQKDFYGNDVKFSDDAKKTLSRLILYYSMCDTSIEIMEHVLNADLSGVRDKAQEIFNGVLKGDSTEEKKSNAQQQLIQFFHSNMDKFIIKNFLHAECVNSGSEENQRKNATIHSQNIKMKWGEWRQAREMEYDSDWDGSIYFYKKGEVAAKVEGINVEKMTKQAKAENWAVLPKTGAGRPMVRGIGRCHAFRICCSDGIDCDELQD